MIVTILTFPVKLLFKLILNLLAAMIGGIGYIIAVGASLAQGISALLGGLVMLSSILMIIFELEFYVVLCAIFGGIALAALPLLAKYIAEVFISLQSELHKFASDVELI